MSGDELDQFIGGMLEARQLAGVSDAVRVQLIADLRERLLDQINKALIDALPEDKMQEFELLLDNPDLEDSAAQQFMIDAGVDVKRVTTETMLRFYDLYVAESHP